MTSHVTSPVTLVASDLDRTLIYSAAALQLPMPDAEAPRLLCVEVYDNKPLSYVTETAAALLVELARSTVFVLLPPPVPASSTTASTSRDPRPGSRSVPTADTSWWTASPTRTGSGR